MYQKTPLHLDAKRYLSIFIRHGNLSLFRAMTYEVVFSRFYVGKLLDFGGGKRVKYFDRIEKLIKSGSYESVNIAADMEPTLIIQDSIKIPLPDMQYDTVLSLNTLEHVYEINETLAELYRLLKPSGDIVIAVPFLFRIHGCPQDFHRPTADWWGLKLSEIGFNKISILPLEFGPLRTAFSVIDRPDRFCYKVIRAVLGVRVLIGVNLRAILNRNKTEGHQETHLNFPIGYVITARR